MAASDSYTLYPEPCQTSKMKPFAKMVNSFYMFDRVRQLHVQG